MSLWKIAWRSIQQRSLASTLTAISMALGVALVIAVLVIHAVIDRSFRRSAQGYDLIVGPRGSRLDLVLNTVYHIGQPQGTIPNSYYEEMSRASGRFAPDVDVAVPIAMGDSYKGYRVIGTNPDMFDRLEYLDKRPYKFREGRNFDPRQPYEAVVGATAARKTGLGLEATFRPTHGEAPDGEEHAPFTIVGILEPTGTPIDRAFFVNLEGFYSLHTQAAEEDKPGSAARQSKPKPKPEAGSAPSLEEQFPHAGPEHDAQPGRRGEVGSSGQSGKEGRIQPPADAAQPKEDHGDHDHGEQAAEHAEHDHDHHHGERRISAILVLSKADDAARATTFPRRIGEEFDAQAVAPAEEIARLFEGLIGDVQLVLLILAVLIVVVAGIGILVSIYNSMNDRRHEIAVMRALGARRGTVMAVILLESILLALGGGAIGILLGHGLTGALSPIIAERTGVVISALQFQPIELIIIPGLVALASLVGYLPAVIAYRTDVAQSLISTP